MALDARRARALPDRDPSAAMTMTALLRPFGRLSDALTDPVRRERAMVLLLAAYALVWALYGTLAKAGQDVHVDMTEIADWSREFAFGYFKHPPLAPYLARIWFAVFPVSDWSYYLFATTIAAVSLWIAWRAALRVLDPQKALAATLILSFIPFFNFHALKFNANTVLMPLWAATTLWFLISYETRSKLYAVLAGVGAAGAMLGKYWSVFLLIGLGVAALLDRRRGDYFRSAAPWLTVVAGALVLAPHLLWLVQNDFAPIRYATTLHGAKPFGDALYASLGYVGGSLGYAFIAIALVWLFFRPDIAAVKDTFLPRDANRRFILLFFALPLFLPALIAPLTGTTLNSLWSMPAWTLLGAVLLASPRTKITKPALSGLLALSVTAPLVLVLAAPVFASYVQRNVEPWQTHTSLLGPQVDRIWAKATSAPLKAICGDAGLAYGASFYSAARPRVCEDISGFAQGTIQRNAAMARDGIAIVCVESQSCAQRIDRLGAGVSGASRDTLTLSRRFMGNDGPSARYTIGIVPPQK
jgi:4-amino-4-deoxy-L-arabinose transferase-like glycosyltransferase